MFKRYSKNPIISPKDIVSSHPEMIDISSVFNPGGIQFGNKILLLLRVQNWGRETLTVKATSDDGVHFSIDDEPIRFTGMDNLDETVFHIYDPRITKIENTYFVMTTMDVVGKCLLGLFKTEDFSSLEFLGITGEEDNRNGVLFPEKINGKYASFDRPNKSLVENGVTTSNAIWYSESDDLIKWESKECPGSQVTANGIEKFILDWLHRITEDKKEFRKISASQAVKKDNERMDKLKKIKSEILGNKKSIQLKLENLLATIESGNAPKTITKRIIELENDLKEIDNSIFKIESELDYLKSRSMTPDDLLVYLKEIVPYMKEMGDKNKPLEL